MHHFIPDNLLDQYSKGLCLCHVLEVVEVSVEFGHTHTSKNLFSSEARPGPMCLSESLLLCSCRQSQYDISDLVGDVDECVVPF